ncbi:dual specificity mitogen-activated protein kinase kinase 1-like [Ceratina calcarata]|uniref:Dual specificity mitogen-activated protein kinase kinase 1-like n=1 Tax=Ceratina calcarata TaxID=156304 RepID=A0AAJ7N4F6_9HYME|nr:dual specificity mitogen-activated protein kinase kinase 1-like [Ceratina calcarata]XP_017881007.1 dual specificity mitogen-activated protein kinase kinase 1-like [Ceratina calcarata]
MIDGNISMEEDTELRDLVVQTLENNGVLAKVRAELRASVFLALEEQESVMNPEPLLNKTVKQYLANSEGKLLFSLVREFLEYFGLDYTISVYDPETYFGKEYNYVGRNKLCEELGIESNEPLLGEILKNSMNSAFNNTQKNEIDRNVSKTDEPTTNAANTTFEISIPKVLNIETTSLSNDNDMSDKLESSSQQSPKLPINVTVTDRKDKDASVHISTNELNCEKQNDPLRNNTTSDYNKKNNGIDSKGNNSMNFDTLPTSPNGTSKVMNYTTKETEIDTPIQTNLLNKTEPLIKFDESIVTEMQTNQNDISVQNNINSLELHIANNVQNKKPVSAGNNYGKTVYFDEIIVDGKRENINDIRNTQTFLEDLPPLDKKSQSILSDLPPLNGKTTDINDLKELMDIGLGTDGTDNYEEDFVSSASGSAYDQSPTKDPTKMDSPIKLETKKHEKVSSAHSEDISEEIEDMDDILSSTSCLEDINMDKNISNFATGITANYAKEL